MKKLLRTKKDKEQFLTWVAFLKAGVFKKGRNALQTKDGYCCLGVGCVLTIPEEQLLVYPNNGLFGSFANEQPTPKWLKRINGDFELRTGEALSTLNDGDIHGKGQKTHKQIADKLLKVYADEL